MLYYKVFYEQLYYLFGHQYRICDSNYCHPTFYALVVMNANIPKTLSRRHITIFVRSCVDERYKVHAVLT